MDSDDLCFYKESESLTNNSQDSINELKKMADFFKIFITTHQDEVQSFQKKLQTPKEKTKVFPSILLTNLIGIYEYFQEHIKKIEVLMNKINNELIKPIDEFRFGQLKIYKENLKKLKDINKDYKDYKDLLDNAKYNYYKMSYNAKQAVINDLNNPIFKAENTKADSDDLIIKNKMMAKNAEYIYQYELFRYNKNIVEINTEYNSIIQKIERAEKSRIYFIKASFDKYRNYMVEYNKNMDYFIKILETYVSGDICSKDEKFYMQEIHHFRSNNNCRIPEEKFISFNDYFEKNKDKIKVDSFNYTLQNDNLKVQIIDENEQKNFINDLLNDLLKEEEISIDKMAILSESLLVKKNKADSILIDCLLDAKNISSVKFTSLKNLKHLANILSFISLKNDSIFKKKFELNFKIIFLSERIFYQNKDNNNKVYLSAILSKNKYFRTKKFWRDVMDLKLALKLGDHIERLRKLILPEERKKGLFSKLGEAMGIKGAIYKNSILAKSRILPLVKYYSELEESKIPIIDKMTSQEMTVIIKESIPNLANFNFPIEDSLDLISNLTEEYKIPKDRIKFLVIYSNVSSYTIRKSLPDDESSKFKVSKYKNIDETSKRLKLFGNCIPYLENKDFANLLTCSKLFNKKLKKKIYSFILKKENVPVKVRLNIWQNLLGVGQLKKKYNYQEILSNANEEKIKTQITLDMTRTSVGNVENKEEIKKHIIDILYAVSQVNGDIKYCQGMNYIGQFLYEVFGEEEAFYLFLSFFENTDYSLIFAKDLKRLNVFFYVFKRILSLFEPELSSYLNSNSVDVNFFLPPWFITLFAGTHQFLRETEDNTPVLIRILDNFVISGWGFMMGLGCSLLHFYENKLLNMKYDELMQFLINDILKTDFFSSKRKILIVNSLGHIKVSKQLIKNIEAEFSQDSKLKELAE